MKIKASEGQRRKARNEGRDLSMEGAWLDSFSDSHSGPLLSVVTAIKWNEVLACVGCMGIPQGATVTARGGRGSGVGQGWLAWVGV